MHKMKEKTGRFKTFARKNKKAIALIMISVVVLLNFTHVMLAFLPYLNLKPVTYEQLKQLNLDRYNKVMIVAHPDDELLWGGAHLIEDDYLVVCITNGDKKVRRKEFENVVRATNDKGIILSYPDKIIKRSNWTFWKKDIEKDIETILSYKKWDTVVTHNEKGEYGHKHHIMTHEMVNEAFDRLDCKGEQFYFGKYFVVDRVPDDLERVDKEIFKIKRIIARNYKSQLNTVRKLYHMMPYERWEQR